MASSFSKHHFPLLTLLLLTSISLPKLTLCNSSTPTKSNQLLAIHSVCKSTPYPDVCFNSLKLSLPINITPIDNLLKFLLQSLQNAISEATKLSSILDTTTGNNNIIENQRGSVQDCKDLHQISIHSLKKSSSKVKSSKLAGARTFLSAALTNKATCLEGLSSASGPQKPMLVNSIIDTYKHVSNSLSMLGQDSSSSSTPLGSKSKSKSKLKSNNGHHRRLLGNNPPSWDRKIVNDDDYDGEGDDAGDQGSETSTTIIVALDGSGNFTSVQDAVNFAPNNSDYRIFIYVRQGVYEENVEIPSSKPNIVLLGDGTEVTKITGKRSVADGWTTFRSATVAVSGDGFLARDITFENSAGPEKHQAVALRINADLAAVYKCTIVGYQDTLYVHSFRQFYRECDIYGTVDYIFGNAAVVFQGCNMVSRLPMPGQFTVITAQSRDMAEENTGIVVQNCSILATEGLYANKSSVKSYLGRPWKEYSRTVIIESYIDDFVHPSGWSKWSPDQNKGLDTLYYGEYGNEGPGAEIQGRVAWPGYHVMDYDEASNFTVSQFIVGDEWLDSTSFPYDDGV